MILHSFLTLGQTCTCWGRAVGFAIVLAVGAGCGGTREDVPVEAPAAEETEAPYAGPTSFFAMEKGDAIRHLPETVALLGDEAPAQMIGPADETGGGHVYGAQAFSDPGQSSTGAAFELPTEETEFSLDLVEEGMGEGMTQEERMWALLRDLKVIVYYIKDLHKLDAMLHPEFSWFHGSPLDFVPLVSEIPPKTMVFGFEKAGIKSEEGVTYIDSVKLGSIDLKLGLAIADGEWKLLSLYTEGESGTGQPKPADIGLQRVNLPDVLNPNGAYEPVDDIQY